MKALVSLVLAVALIGGIYIASTSGCGARAQVAGDKILNSIDKMLGELDVKRKKIENKQTALKDVIEKVRTQKVQSGVQLKQYQEKIAPLQGKVQQIRQVIAKIRPLMNAEGDQEMNGTTYTQEELSSMANDLADEFERLNQKIGAYETSVNGFQESYNLLSSQYENALETMKDMDAKIEEIDTKKETLDAMKVNQKILGESGSISDQFISLRKEIDELFVDVETGLAVEKEKMAERERDMNSATKNVDNIIDELEGKEETKTRLDAILGEASDGQ